MTLHFPDLSNNNGLLDITGVPALIAKATEGTGFVDVDYPAYRDAARAAGIPFMAYHYLHHGDTTAQAQHAFSVVGTDVPLMIDVEVVEGGSDPQLADVLDFITAYRELGGKVVSIYLPEWFRSGHWGSPQLNQLRDLGLFLVSSNYQPYSDTGPGWEPYGGLTPAIWQYTNAGDLHGAHVDYNAYRGTAAQLAELFNGGNPTVDSATILAIANGSAADGSGYLDENKFPDGPDRWAAAQAAQHNIRAVQEQIDLVRAQIAALQATCAQILAMLGTGATPAGLVQHVHAVLDHTLTPTQATTGPAEPAA